MDDGAGLPTSAYECAVSVCICLSMLFIPSYFLYFVKYFWSDASK